MLYAGLLAILLAGCASQVALPVLRLNNQPGTVHEPGLIVQVEVIIIGMLLISAIVSLLTQRFRIPYTVGLVLVGFGLTFL